MVTKTQYRQNKTKPLNITQYWIPCCHLCEMADTSIECIVMFRNKAEEYKIPIPARQGFYGSHIEFQVTWYLGVFKFTNEEIIPQNMELDMKITFLDSMIPK